MSEEENNQQSEQQPEESNESFIPSGDDNTYLEKGLEPDIQKK